MAISDKSASGNYIRGADTWWHRFNMMSKNVGNRSFGGDWQIIDDNNVKLHMRRCMIIDEFVPQGIYGLGDQFDGTKMWEFNCRHEAMGATAFLPGVQLDIRLPRIDLKFEEGEAYCVWTYCKRDPNNPAHKAPTCHSPCGTCKM